MSKALYSIVCVLSVGCATLSDVNTQNDKTTFSVTPNSIAMGAATKVILHTDTNNPVPNIAISPGGPFLLDQLSLPATTTQLVAGNNTIFASTLQHEILALQLYRGNLKIVGKFAAGQPINTMAIWQNTLYIALSNKNLIAVDISDTANLKLTNAYPLSENITHLAFNAEYIYAVLNTTKVGVFNHPAANTSPVLLNSIVLPQEINDLKMANDVAYITGPQLGIASLVFKVPDTLVVADTQTTSGTPLQLTIRDNFAYVADGARGLTIFDISDPKQMRWLGSNNKLGPVYSSHGYENGIIVDNEDNRLASIDVSNPQLPIIGSLFMPNTHFNQLVALDNIAFISNGKNILAIDFSVAAAAQISNEGINLGGSRRAFVTNNIAYVADWFSGLHIYDVSIAQQPRHLGNYHTPGSSKGVVVKGNYAFVGDDDHGLQIIDISNPTKPVWVSSIQTAGLAYTMTLVEDIIYLADHRGGFDIINVADVKNPQLIGSYDTPGKSWAIKVVDQIAYVADDQSGLLIFDISNPKKPQQIGSFNINAYAEDVVIDAGLAYVAFFDKGLYIVDISNPTHPREVGNVAIPGNARSVSIVNGYAYIAGWESGIQIVDVSNPAAPHIVGFYDTDGSAWGVDINYPYAYVWDWWGGMKVLSVADPKRPQLVGKYQSQGKIQHLALNDNYLFTANGSRGLQVFDIKNPLNPIWTTGIDMPGNAQDLILNNNIAYIAAGDGGVVAINIADPFNIQWLGKWGSSGSAYKVRIHDNTLYVADDHDELNILDASDPSHLYSVAHHSLAINDLAIQNNQLLVVTRDKDLNVFDLQIPDQLSLMQRLHFEGELQLIHTNDTLVFVYEVGFGIRLFHYEQGQLLAAGNIKVDEPVSHMQTMNNMLYITAPAVGLLEYNLDNLASPQLTTLYPATDTLTSLAVSPTAAFFAGKNTITSINLLPELSGFAVSPSQTQFTVPADMPLGHYNLILQNADGKIVSTLPNALAITLSKPKKPKFTMDDFKKALKQQTQPQK